MFSCGTATPYWSDDVPPTAVGVATTMTAYMSQAPGGSCKVDPPTYNRNLQVMRCSLRTPDDLIYKYTPHCIDEDRYVSICPFAFCGMK